jgi:hypothetical protein
LEKSRARNPRAEVFEPALAIESLPALLVID